MIYQMTNGVRRNSVRVSGSVADLTILSGVLEGECEILDLKSSGGTAETIPVLNALGFSVGKKSITNSYRSASVVFAHIMPTKTLADIRLAVKGIWDADFTTVEKCVYVNGFRANSKG
ncbi:MAG: hypothetical protein Q8R86_09695 [Sulfuricurvum sp.]|nr:hypothetical protein [Sulfuricurvum sp.]